MESSKSEWGRAQQLEHLGLYIIGEYNTTGGVYTQDPQGFSQDITDQINHIFAPEIESIRRQADLEREFLKRDIAILKLEMQNAIKDSLLKFYENMAAFQRQWRKSGSCEEEPADSLRRQMRNATFGYRVSIDENMKVPLCHFDRSRAQRIEIFEHWLERHYGI